MNTETLVNVLAWTSLIVSTIPMLFNLFVIFLVMAASCTTRHKVRIKIGYSFFVWMALFVWPIVYFIIK